MVLLQLSALALVLVSQIWAEAPHSARAGGKRPARVSREELQRLFERELYGA